MRHTYDTEALEAQIFGSGPGWTDVEEPDTEEADTEELEDAGLAGTADPVIMEVTLEDGTQTEYIVAGVFLEGEKEYIAPADPGRRYPHHGAFGRGGRRGGASPG